MADYARAHKVCSTVLQPTEVLKIAVHVKDGVNGLASSSDSYLAIISNVDAGIEEGCLLLINGDTVGSSQVFIRSLCPIYQDFAVDIEQAEVRQPDPFKPGLPTQARFNVKYTSASGRASVSTITTDIASLGDLLKEAKRLSDIANEHHLRPDGASHAWLTMYRPASATQGFEFSTARGILTRPARQDSLSSLLSYASKGIEGLPALAQTFGTSFGFLGSAQPARPRGLPSAMSIFSSQKPQTSSPVVSYAKIRKEEDDVLSLDKATLGKLRSRKAEYTSQKDYKVHVCTFNANGEFYDSEQDLSDWLKPEDEPDIVVVGLQEMDLRPEVVMVRHDPLIGEQWIAGILRTLARNPKEGPPVGQEKSYQTIESKQLAGLWIAVFAKNELVESGVLAEVCTTSVMTGWAGFAGNKGACAVRMTLHDTSLAFVTAHLAAGQDMSVRRNADFQDIAKRTVFSLPDAHSPTGYQYASLDDSDLVTFLGDLNYRLDSPTDVVRELLRNNDSTPLLQKDQLKLAQSARLAFVGYEEAEIAFPCTYKFDKGSDEYDTSEKDRKPAWTDRILWKVLDDRVKVACQAYTSITGIRTSDHRPVLARLTIQVSELDRQTRTRIAREIQEGSPKPPVEEGEAGSTSQA